MDDIALVISIVTTVALVLTLIFTFRQLREDIKVRRLQAFQALLEQWSQAKNNTKYVLTKFNYKGGRKRILKVDDVCARCNRIGFLVSKGLIPERDVAEFIGGSMIKLWEKVKLYVKNLQQTDVNIQYKHFQNFVKICNKKYWKKRKGILYFNFSRQLKSLTRGK